MNKLLKTFILVLFCSYSFGQNNVIGLWGTKCEDGFMACQQMHFKSDSSFEYGIFMDVGGWNFMEGYWKLHGDTIILNTFKQPKETRNRSYYDSTVKGSLLKLSLDSNIVKKVIIRINQNELIDTLSYNQSLLVSEKINIQKIAIINLENNEDGIILLPIKRANIFEVFSFIVILTPDFTYLTNEKWLIKENKIYYYRNDNGDFENNYYVKTDLRNKRFNLNK